MLDSTSADSTTIYQSIFSGCEAFVFRCKTDGQRTMVFMEGSVEEIAGYRADQIVGNSVVTFGSLAHEEDRDRVTKEIEGHIKTGKPWNILYRLSGSDSEENWIRERGTAVVGDQGEVEFVQGVIVSAKAEVGVKEDLSSSTLQAEQTFGELAKLAAQITQSIKSLSFLAVNARIEAARCGDAGRGFAIIASDITDLVKENQRWVGQFDDILKKERK